MGFIVFEIGRRRGVIEAVWVFGAYAVGILVGYHAGASP